MGLDMYLTQKRHITNYNFDPEGQALSAKILEVLKVPDPQHYNNGSIEVSLPVGYWRKANHIHQWFVDNVQGSEDNCEEYYVPREKLAELLDLCQQVKATPSKASELLPRSQGFFFGSYEYDDWYFEQINDTIQILEYCLDKTKVSDSDYFYYRSSW